VGFIVAMRRTARSEVLQLGEPCQNLLFGVETATIGGDRHVVGCSGRKALEVLRS
jgi:hypothetical protein